MKQITRQLLPLAAAFSLVIATAPARAQDGDVGDGFDLLSEGTRLLLRGLLSEMEPALEELQGVLEGLDTYHPPQVLPNGDIIIRRKRPEEAAPLPEGEIEI